MCCLQKTHFEYNDIGRLELQECKNITYTNAIILIQNALFVLNAFSDYLKKNLRLLDYKERFNKKKSQSIREIPQF